MSGRNGDRSRFHRGRKAKIARRLRWREIVVNGKEMPSATNSAAKPRADKFTP
jgi:hypothetical protein